MSRRGGARLTRARLAQAEANVDAAEARLANVDAETQLQHALIRQAEAQRLANLAEMNLARKASDRRRELIRTNAVSQAQVDESDAALSKTEAGVAAAAATVEAQRQRIAVLTSQREAAIAAVAQAEAALGRLPHNDIPLRLAVQARRHVLEADVEKLIVAEELHDFIDVVQTEIGDIHDAIVQCWFPQAVATA